MTLAAGLPSVAIPSIFDQVWHAKRQVELGTGLHAKKTKHLRAAITELIENDTLADNARGLAAKINEEDGTANACDRIEAFLAERIPQD